MLPFYYAFIGYTYSLHHIWYLFHLGFLIFTPFYLFSHHIIVFPFLSLLETSIVGSIIVGHWFDMAAKTIFWAPTSLLFHIVVMSLNVRQIVKKISGVFKKEPTAPPAPNVTLAWYSLARLPPLPFIPIFKVTDDLPPSVEIENLEHQLLYHFN